MLAAEERTRFNQEARNSRVSGVCLTTIFGFLYGASVGLIADYFFPSEGHLLIWLIAISFAAFGFAATLRMMIADRNYFRWLFAEMDRHKAWAPGRRIDVPPRIQNQILHTLRGRERPLSPMDEQARSHGAIALWATLGQIWGLRPDGSLWKFDADLDVPIVPLEPEWNITAIFLGAARYSWLAELIPPRPSDARDCPRCEGTGWIAAGLEPDSGGVICQECRALGWSVSWCE